MKDSHREGWGLKAFLATLHSKRDLFTAFKIRDFPHYEPRCPLHVHSQTILTRTHVQLPNSALTYCRFKTSCKVLTRALSETMLVHIHRSLHVEATRDCFTLRYPPVKFHISIDDSKLVSRFRKKKKNTSTTHRSIVSSSFKTMSELGSEKHVR